MRFRLLGPIEVCDEQTGRRVHPRSQAQQSLLAALLAEPGAPVDAGALVFEVWGRAAPAKASNALQAHVSRLRRCLMALEPGRRSPRLVKQGRGYALRTEDAQIDAEHFLHGLAAADTLKSQDPAAASSALQRALQLWRGPALGGCRLGPIGAALAARLEQARADAQRELALNPQRGHEAAPHPRAQDATVLTRAAAVHPVPGPHLLDVFDRLDRLAAEQRALRHSLDRLCALAFCEPPRTQPHSAGHRQAVTPAQRAGRRTPA
jgi:hypothetical protein